MTKKTPDRTGLAKTFWADCTVLREANATAEYLAKSWNVKLNIMEPEKQSSKNTNALAITVRDYPPIMIDVEESGYFEPQTTLWQIMRISPDGVSLYLVNCSGLTNEGTHHLWEECFIFIPMSNVIAIHNVSPQFLVNESVDSIGRLERDPKK